MKRVLSLMLVLALCFAMCACGTSESEEKTATTEELAQATDLIKKAEEAIITAAAHQLDGWTTYANIMKAYFVDSEYENVSEISIKNRAENIHNLRVEAQIKLEEAKTLIGANGSSEYYDAVKEYHKTVNVFWNLISEFPEGYSKLTYMNTVSDHKAKCADAYAELAFYN